MDIALEVCLNVKLSWDDGDYEGGGQSSYEPGIMRPNPL